MRHLKKAIIHLRSDPVLASLIDKYGLLNYRPSRDHFQSLVYSIIEQQLSSKAAHTIYSRFEKLFPQGKLTPQLILNIPQEKLRGIGTSWAKARSLHDLSQKIQDKTVRLDDLSIMSDEEIVTHLTWVKGIGRWSAEMFLMFNLHSPDVFPLDDVGIQNAFVKHYRLNRSHKTLKHRMEKIAHPWRPFRTVACWYLWKSLDSD